MTIAASTDRDACALQLSWTWGKWLGAASYLLVTLAFGYVLVDTILAWLHTNLPVGRFIIVLILFVLSSARTYVLFNLSSVSISGQALLIRKWSRSVRIPLQHLDRVYRGVLLLKGITVLSFKKGSPLGRRRVLFIAAKGKGDVGARLQQSQCVASR